MRKLFPVALLLLGGAACASSSEPGPSAPSPAPSEVAIHTPGRDVVFQVEIADTSEERRQGLMNRASLAANAGMIFVFPNEDVHVFWMKNTLIPLDMVFMNASRTIVGIVANAEPLTETPRGADLPASLYVLEIPGGTASRDGIATGQSATLVRIPERAIE